ncbi:MAG: hypothetical protein IT285_09125 [Bdellovibrionales bacterium]|nr:hypothetical protein [Bdellovibrionales bacterium]
MGTGENVRAGLLLAAALLGTSKSAQAYSLTEHRRITDQAIADFNFCFSDALVPLLRDWIQTANRNEDLNLLRKWSLYSHFYHPGKDLDDLSRLDSSLRIALLQKEIGDLNGQGDEAESFYELGHAIHHIQDMASPPHVVPVRHGLFDSYEGWNLSPLDFPARRIDRKYCRKLRDQQVPGGLYQILNETAWQSLSYVKTPLRLQYNGYAADVTWEWFWKESSSPEFGDYGWFGNRFGESPITFGDAHRYEIPRATYLAFKKRQLALAIDRTVQALVWYFRNR